ncbi:LysR family transcriptional regulator [Acidocella sp.]|uniref:LysR family transcriptional regulator n=1 Tax=Acidocella sp. TaxID=50710 RepID=UPI003D04A459
MDRLAEITAFVKVAQTGSFAEAARQMHVSATIVSKHVRELEEWLGVRLFNRTTRHVALTEIGHVVHERCADLLAQFNELETTAGRWRGEPRGVLRISAPLSFGGGPLAARLPRFAALYPHVTIDLTLMDRYVDVVEEGFDVAIAIGELPDSSAKARLLCNLRSSLYASPAYLAAQGCPTKAEDLLAHNCLLHIGGPLTDSWGLTAPDGQRHHLKVKGTLRTNSVTALLTSVLAGQGVTLLPDYTVAEALAEGRVVKLLPDHHVPELPVRVVYQPGRHLAAKVPAFIDFVTGAFPRTS